MISTDIVTPSGRPPSQDFYFLREEGLKHIQALAGRIWTDHNTHDPGFTILEALVYAMTDLGYRTKFPVQDLVADIKQPDSVLQNQFYTAREILVSAPVNLTDYRKLLMDLPGIRNAWLSTLPANDHRETPLLASRKEDALLYREADKQFDEVLVDVKIDGLYKILLEYENDIENGDLNSRVYRVPTQLKKGPLKGVTVEFFLPEWFDQDLINADTLTIPIRVNPAGFVLNIRSSDNLRLWTADIQLQLNGPSGIIEFTDIRMQLSDGVINSQSTTKAALNTALTNWLSLPAVEANIPQSPVVQLAEAYRKRVQKILEVTAGAQAALHANRNLSEDFFRYQTVDMEELALCMDFILENDADIEQVLAEAWRLIDNYLLPPIRFRSLQEMLDEDIPVKDIFNGPALKHGFLKQEELDAQKLEGRKVYVSDIINLLSDIPGVIALQFTQMVKYDSDGNVRYNSSLQNNVANQWMVSIRDDHRVILNKFKSKFKFFKEQIPFTAKLEEAMKKLEILNAQDVNLKLIDSKNDLDIPRGKNRKLDKHYSIQLEFPKVYGIGEKGLPDSASNERKSQARQLKAYLMYFDQLLANYLSQLTQLKYLYSWDESVDATLASQFLPNLLESDDILYEDAATLKSTIGSITENNQDFLERRNRVLDHLIARFAESFNEYALLIYASKDQSLQESAEDLLTDKVNFLKDYPKISSRRGTAYNYLEASELWDTDENISGYVRRVCRLLGIDDPSRRSLGDKDEEGLHLIEHLLLRPRTTNPDSPLLSICLEDDCNGCGDEDPYSFRLTLILPNWAGRFANMDFRRYAERVFHLEAPAHLHLKICWVNQVSMQAFEVVYQIWLQQLANQEWLSQASVYNLALKNLIDQMQSMSSDYPPAHLHDCDDDTKEVSVVLGETILGSLNHLEDDNT